MAQSKPLVGLIIGVLLGGLVPWHTGQAALPEIGTAGVSALSIAQEKAYGEVFLNIANASLPLIHDPVLTEYISNLGQRLVLNADGVRFPFGFFLVNDPSINAAAFLGGKVKVHSGLLLYANDESELAGVLAHEIIHVTQRHIARFMESQTRNAGVTLAALVGSVAVALVDPAAGMAALQATLGVSMQSAINYTRENEFEADRLAIELLYNAGFAPDSMANFFQTLTAEYRFASKPPEMLLTHPLPENRISEAKARAQRYPKRVVSPNLDFLLAKARLLVRYSQGATANQFKTWDKAGGTYRAAAVYGRALQALQRNDAKGATALLIPLQQQYEDNLFVVDALTDAALLDKDYASALARLTPLHQNLPFNPVVVLNLAQTYQEQGNTQAVIGVLEPYVRRVKDDVLAWHMLTQAHRAKGDQVRAYMSQAEELALRADYQGGIVQLNQAKALVKDNYTAMLISARIDELRQANIALENTL